MKRVFFSDILPSDFSNTEGFISAKEFEDEFLSSCNSYRTALQKFSCIERGIITEKQPSEILIYDKSLLNIIKDIRDKDFRSYIMNAFSKYPLEEKISEDTLEKALYDDMIIEINGIKLCNHIILNTVYYEYGILLVIPFCKYLRESFLFHDRIPSLHSYNFDEFCSFIYDEILEETSDDYEKIKILCEKFNYTPVFSIFFNNTFNKLPKTKKEKVIDKIKECFEKKYFESPDNDKIEVEDGRIWAIRIHNPVIRIYFEVYNGKIYFASIYDDHQDRMISKYIYDAKSIISDLKQNYLY